MVDIDREPRYNGNSNVTVKGDDIMLNDKEIGQRIALLREEKEYTQEQISLLLNVTP
ncbi:hypothetical protein SPSIL_048780 [Sporomusa silvacetica DSM 10669]|uniref:HTH cro/C1-type domain-containing protein n=1 Tax=Sporomusa silvacetica DSM 10669 TaxID=1123289 RepID=A0ABZ3ISU5_9FIRM|nr:hypothetical protein [Sporomusa silvacetica]OZC14647.1 hypothetical protein SPSIL_47980 [Sporomusa silvacetica DSM 10669]